MRSPVSGSAGQLLTRLGLDTERAKHNRQVLSWACNAWHRRGKIPRRVQSENRGYEYYVGYYGVDLELVWNDCVGDFCGATEQQPSLRS